MIIIQNSSSLDVYKWHVSNMTACFDTEGRPAIKAYVEEIHDIHIFPLDVINKIMDNNTSIAPYIWWKNDIYAFNRYFELHLQLEKIQSIKKDMDNDMKDYYKIMYNLLYKLKYKRINM